MIRIAILDGYQNASLRWPTGHRRHDLGSGRRHLWFRPIQGSHRGRGKEPWQGAVHVERV